MIKKNSVLIILLIFTAISYIIIYRLTLMHSANSFAIGFLAAGIDLLLLRRLIVKFFGGATGFIFIPFSLLRWALFVIILFAAIRYYKADLIFLIVGIIVPFVILVADQVYRYILSNRKTKGVK